MSNTPVSIARRRPEEPSRSPGGGRPRAAWHVRANALVLAYAALAVVALVAHDRLPLPRWLAIHLLLLGAATNAVVTWGEHFAVALLRAPSPTRRHSAIRLAALNAGIVGVLVGVSVDLPVLTTAAAVALGLVVGEHVVNLVRLARRALQGRFAGTVRFYVAGGVALVAGITLGTELAVGTDHTRHEAFHAAHVHANVLGWVGLTVLGTLFTLWPTVLRTRMVDDVMRWARRCLALTAAGLTATVPALALGNRPVAVAGLVVYGAGVGTALRPFVATWRRRAPHDAASWSLAAAVGWLLVCVVTDLLMLATAPDLAAYLPRLDALVPVLVVGFVAQVLLGALTYLLPVVLGAGPSGVRAVIARVSLGWPVRLAALNVGAALLALPAPGWASMLGWALVLAAGTAFVVLAVSVLLPSTRPTPEIAMTKPDSAVDEHPGRAAPAAGRPARAGRNPAVGGIVLGLVMTLVPVLIALSGHTPPTGPSTVAASGGSRSVAVSLADMDIRPGVIEVAPGTRLRLVVTNHDAMAHDVYFPGGPHTRLLTKDESQTIDLGTVTADRSGWCTVPGHKAAGMTLDIRVKGSTAATSAAGHDSVPGMATGGRSAGTAPRDVDVHGQPGPGWTPYDASLAPAPGGTLHRITLHVVEKEMEVAPGVRQRMWTYNGTVPGPVLRGRVGDVFEVTLVNDGSMGHGIDFHAGSLAPDVPMRTIQPGERLVYRFRADHSGAWLYHCSTMPMLQHIANGMYGAVVIDPPDLPKVDREYVLVGSELYLGPQGGIADPAKLRADEWDAATFNGYPDQYVHAPLKAKVGERVRFWVVDAGPSDGVAFHVVGTQFDTVFKEGAYLLRPGNAEHGAAQVLDLSAAEGGFVETTFPQAGHYPVVDHDMRRAENGARGVVEVTR